jgi:putative endonuclease
MLSKGLAYEKTAMLYLQRQGLEILDNNFRSKLGEIDLIMKDKNTIVFIEVRFRAINNYGDGAETITKSKQLKIIKTAKSFLSQKKLWNNPCRFDVVSINKHPNNTKVDINWIPAAFSA